jgi:predicted anti-sigma-YlaC factor YlaD
MTSCLEVRRLAPRFLALDLPPDSEGEVREHLRSCEACREAMAGREPALRVAWAMAAEPSPEDDRFVGEVLAGVHQRALERRLSGRRSRLLGVAATIAAVLLGGAVVVRELTRPAPPAVAQVSQQRPPAAEPAFVEVDGAGVRLYQLTPTSQSREAIQVAFIVDPHLEL